MTRLQLGVMQNRSKDMNEATRFRLRVTAYTPETIPMARLAQYMQEFAALMGSEASVRFRGVTKGSTVLNAEVQREEVPKIDARLHEASDLQASDKSDDVRKIVDRIEAMLRADNARGTIAKGNQRIVTFLGIDAVMPERIGPIHEATTVEGEVQRVGGSDKTIHALLLAEDGRVLKLTTRSRELAKQLAVELFSQVRAQGTGIWFRNEQGKWELEELRLERFEPVSPRSLLEAVGELRAVEGSGWESMRDPLAIARDLRKH
jgi:hypothetical protein